MLALSMCPLRTPQGRQSRRSVRLSDGDAPPLRDAAQRAAVPSRRRALCAAAGLALAAGPASPATASQAVGSAVIGAVQARPGKGPEDMLVWKSASTSDISACTAAETRAAFGPKFCNYLTRFLLSYDRPSRRLWRARAAELPLGWSEKQLVDARISHLAEYVGAVERSLCGYAPKNQKAGEALSVEDAANIRRLLTLLRSRYGSQPDALRQLALLFSLLPPEAQPTDAIEQLAAEQENRDSAEIVVIDGGSFVLSDAFLAEGMPAPALPLPAAPLKNRASKAAVAGVPLIRATGRVIEMVVTNGGAGYDDENPPLVSITAPLSVAAPADVRSTDRSVSNNEPWRTGRRAAQAKAIVRNGRVVALELTDVGAGYNRASGVQVVIAKPPGLLKRRGSSDRPRRRGPAEPATGKVLLEYEIGSVGLVRKGSGYGSSQDLDVRFFSRKTAANAVDGGNRTSSGTAASGKRQAAAIKAPGGNFQTPSALELAEAPWSQEVMAAKYGDRATARSTSDMLVLRPPSATLVLGKRRRPDTGLAASAAAAQKPRRPGPVPRVSSDEPPLPRPPQLPSSPRDSGVIDGLLALLPPEEGAPIFSPGFPPSKKNPVGVPTRHRFPSNLYEAIVDDYVIKAPLGPIKDPNPSPNPSPNPNPNPNPQPNPNPRSDQGPAGSEEEKGWHALPGSFHAAHLHLRRSDARCAAAPVIGCAARDRRGSVLRHHPRHHLAHRPAQDHGPVRQGSHSSSFSIAAAGASSTGAAFCVLMV